MERAPSMDMTPKNEVRIQSQVIELRAEGAGSISRAARLDGNPELTASAEQAQQELCAGEFHVEARIHDCTRCGDGRGTEVNNGGTQGFGGTPGIIKSEVIAGVIEPGASAVEAIEREVQLRNEVGKKSGAHTADTHGDAEKCGCGECDGAQKALAEVYLPNEEDLKKLVTGLWQAVGLEDRYGDFDETMYEEIIDTVRQLTATNYFADGAAQVQAVEAYTADDTVVEALAGDHKEVIWVINTVKGTKFNQKDFLAKYDRNPDDKESGIQAFWEDQWAIEEEFASRHKDEADYEPKMKKTLQADLVRRVATAANLTAADLNIIVLS